MNLQEDERKKCIPIYMYDLNKPFENEKYLKSLDKIGVSVAQPLSQIQVVETKENVRMLSDVEDLVDSQANI